MLHAPALLTCAVAEPWHFHQRFTGRNVQTHKATNWPRASVWWLTNEVYCQAIASQKCRHAATHASTRNHWCLGADHLCSPANTSMLSLQVLADVVCQSYSGTTSCHLLMSWPELCRESSRCASVLPCLAFAGKALQRAKSKIMEGGSSHKD